MYVGGQDAAACWVRAQMRTGPRGPAHVIIGQRRAAKFAHSAPRRAAIFKLLRAEDHDDITAVA